MRTASTGKARDALLAALRKLLANGGAMPLFARAPATGLFPSKSTTAQNIIQQLVAVGWLTVTEPLTDKSSGRITAAGRAALFAAEDPRVLLEDLLRATEAQAETLEKLRAACTGQLELVQDRSADIRAALDRLDGMSAVQAAALEQTLEDRLRAAGPGAVSLADLYHTLSETAGRLTIGQFHDCLRSLHRAGRIRLAPWTGPLYQLPQPQLGLLIGHEVLYYVDLARANAA